MHNFQHFRGGCPPALRTRVRSPQAWSSSAPLCSPLTRNLEGWWKMLLPSLQVTWMLFTTGKWCCEIKTKVGAAYYCKSQLQTLFTVVYSIAKLFQTKPFCRGSLPPGIHPSRELQSSGDQDVPLKMPAATAQGCGMHSQAPSTKATWPHHWCCHCCLRPEPLLKLTTYGLWGKWWSVAFYFYTLSFHLYTDKGTAASNLTSKSRAWYGNFSGIVDAILNWPMRLKCQLLSLWQLCVALVVGLFCCLLNFCTSSWGSGVRGKLCSHFSC